MIYKLLDEAILNEIKFKQDAGMKLNPLCNYWINKEAEKFMNETGRSVDRIIDGRLTALKNQKKIKFDRSTVSKWVLL